MGERLSELEKTAWHVEGRWVARRDQVSVKASKTPGSEPAGALEPDWERPDILRNLDLMLEAVRVVLGF